MISECHRHPIHIQTSFPLGFETSLPIDHAWVFLTCNKFCHKPDSLSKRLHGATARSHCLPSLMPDGSLLTSSQEMTRLTLKLRRWMGTFGVSSFNLGAKVGACKTNSNMLILFIAEQGQHQQGMKIHLPLQYSHTFTL